jgi:peptidoglycan/LPS O-acetylase OafA/YrhL
MTGVSIFFFLSGYLITTLLRREFERDGSISIKNFYIRRVLRIFPPLYITIGFMFIVYSLGLMATKLDWVSLAAACTFTVNFVVIIRRQIAGGFSPMWSLAVEEHFYLLFPLVFTIFNRLRIPNRRQAAYLLGACLLVLLWRIFLVFVKHPVGARLEEGTDTRIDMILFGCILALASNPVLDRPRPPSSFVVVLAVLALVVTSVTNRTDFRYSIGYTLQGLAFMPLFTVAITRSEDLFRVLNLSWVKFIGTLSYTLYLVHLFLFKFYLHEVTSLKAAILLTLISSLAYAWLMNSLVERPIAGLRRRLDAGRNV